MLKLKSFIFIFLCLFFVTCLEVNEDVTINFSNLNSKYTGKKGIIAIEASPSDKFSEDTSRKIYFHTKLQMEQIHLMLIVASVNRENILSLSSVI